MVPTKDAYPVGGIASPSLFPWEFHPCALWRRASVRFSNVHEYTQQLTTRLFGVLFLQDGWPAPGSVRLINLSLLLG